MNIINTDTKNHIKNATNTSFILLVLSISCFFLLRQNASWIEANELATVLKDQYLKDSLTGAAITYLAIHLTFIVIACTQKMTGLLLIALSIGLNIHAGFYYKPVQVTINKGDGELIGIDRTIDSISIISGELNDLNVLTIPQDVYVKENNIVPIGKSQTYSYFWLEHNGLILPEKYRSLDYFVELKTTKHN